MEAITNQRPIRSLSIAAATCMTPIGLMGRPRMGLRCTTRRRAITPARAITTRLVTTPLRHVITHPRHVITGRVMAAGVRDTEAEAGTVAEAVTTAAGRVIAHRPQARGRAEATALDRVPAGTATLVAEVRAQADLQAATGAKTAVLVAAGTAARAAGTDKPTKTALLGAPFF